MTSVRVKAQRHLLGTEDKGTPLFIFSLGTLARIEKIVAAVADEIGDIAPEKARIGIVDGDVAQFTVLDVGGPVQTGDPAARYLQQFTVQGQTEPLISARIMVHQRTLYHEPL